MFKKISMAGLGLACLALPSAGFADEDTGSRAVTCGRDAVKIGQPYKGVFFANDFRYLDDPCLAQSDSRHPWVKMSDGLKRRRLGEGLVMDIGGEFRLRYHDENKMARTRLSGLNNEFLLSRLRAYINIEAGDNFRFYAEGIDASSGGEDFPPRGIEVDRADFLNLFGEFRGRAGDGKVSVRFGRQELLLGAQRLVSPLNWGNTRRTFDGLRVTFDNPNWSVSVFATRPRRVLPDAFNKTNGSQAFAGIYNTYKGKKGHTLDIYGLYFGEDQSVGTNFDLYTMGARWKVKSGPFFFEAEGAIQSGNFNGLDHDAGMFTLGAGYKAADWPGQPAFQLYYDWASGDNDPNDNSSGTFRQLHPLGHAYFGFMDLIGRQNIKAWNARVTAKPLARLTVQATVHNFNLAARRDAQFNAGGGGIRRDVSGASGKDIGRELDLTANFVVIPRTNLILGYSWFWGGDFVDATNPVGVSGNANFFYSMLVTKF